MHPSISQANGDVNTGVIGSPTVGYLILCIKQVQRWAKLWLE